MVSRQRSALTNLNSVMHAELCLKTLQVIITAEEQDICKAWLAAQENNEENSSVVFAETHKIRDGNQRPENQNRRIAPARKTNSKSGSTTIPFNFLDVQQTTATDWRPLEALTGCFVKAKNASQQQPDRLIWKVGIGSLAEYRYSLRYNGFVPTGNTNPRLFINDDEAFEIVQVCSISNDVVVLV